MIFLVGHNHGKLVYHRFLVESSGLASVSCAVKTAMHEFRKNVSHAKSLQIRSPQIVAVSIRLIGGEWKAQLDLALRHPKWYVAAGRRSNYSITVLYMLG